MILILFRTAEIYCSKIKTTQEEIEQLEQEINQTLEQEKHIHKFVPKIKTVLEAYYATTDVEKKIIFLSQY